MTPSDYIKDLAIKVFNGELKALDAYAELHAIKKDLDDAIESVKEQAITDVIEYGKEGTVINGYRFIKTNAAGRWMFGNVTLYNQYKDKLKNIEELAKMASKTGGHVTTEDGEVIEPAVFIAGGETITAKLEREK